MISVRAPAKINLTLHVTGRRADGYHLLDSIAVFAADAADVLSLEPAADMTLSFSGPFADALSGATDNLILKAAHLFARETGASLPYHFHLEKNLPLGAGLGGGSADAAAAVRLLEQSSGKNLDSLRRKEILLEIGADVPVCDETTACRFQGVGEIITPVPQMPPLFLLLVWPNVHSVTKDVFAKRDAGFDASMTIPARFEDIHSFIAFLKEQENGLSKAACALYPAIEDAMHAVAATKNCLLPRMSGSGSCVFGIYETETQAKSAGELIKAGRPGWWSCVTAIL